MKRFHMLLLASAMLCTPAHADWRKDALDDIKASKKESTPPEPTPTMRVLPAPGATRPPADVPQSLTGVPHIHDGDTVEIGGVKVRLAGIDAPEKDQLCLDSKSQPWACGEAALAELAKKAGDRPWTCHVSGRYSFDRLLGSCRVDGEDIQRWMVRSGLALSYTRYSHVYDADEKTAREERAGLWSGAFIRPEAWRHRDKSTEILAAVSVPVDAQKILLRPEPRGKISAKIPAQTPTETPTPSPTVTLPTAPTPMPSPTVTLPTAPTPTPSPTVTLPTAPTPTPSPTVTLPTAPTLSPTATLPTAPSGATIHVQGYTRKDGTIVAPYERRAPSPHKP
jgi:endonuclease YncB( thermonuclease family)